MLQACMKQVFKECKLSFIYVIIKYTLLFYIVYILLKIKYILINYYIKFEILYIVRYY